MRTIYRFLPVLAAALLAGCSWEPLPPPEAPPAERVLVMYDNIGTWFYDDVKEAGTAVAAGALDSGERVVVFHRNYSVEGQNGARSVIYELVRDSSQKDGFRRVMLRVYESGENAALSKEVMERVVGDIRVAIPAEHYGLAFGSHGKGWIPRSSTVSISRKNGGVPYEHPFAEFWAERDNPLTRYFQSDWGEKFDVSEFVDALDAWKWDFIILDDCFMASVEALYEMRTLADYIIASPTEIIKYGFPYDMVVETVFNDWTDVKGLGEVFIDYYENQVSDLPFGTIAVVKMSGMDALATTVRNLNLRLSEQLDAVTGIQFYEGYTRPGHIFYDLDDYLIRIRKNTMPAEYNAFLAQLEQTVVFKGHTDDFYSDFPYGFGGTIVPVTHFSGLSVFIPWSRTAPLFPDYQKTVWYKAIYTE